MGGWGLGGGLRAACGLAKERPLSLTDDASRAHAHGGHAPSKTLFASRVTCLPLRHLEASVRVAGGALPVDAPFGKNCLGPHPLSAAMPLNYVRSPPRTLANGHARVPLRRCPPARSPNGTTSS